jgi:hypothetical protein
VSETGGPIVEHKSPYDEVPRQLVHRPEALSATASELDRLTKAIYQDAVAALRSAAARQTAAASAAVLEEEARNVLRELLEDPDVLDEDASGDERRDDRSLRQSLERAVETKARHSLEGETPAWLEVRSLDLARSIAGVWMDFGREESARLEVVERLLKGSGTPHASAIDDLARRFELSTGETRDLLGATRSRFRSLILDLSPGVQSSRHRGKTRSDRTRVAPK